MSKRLREPSFWIGTFIGAVIGLAGGAFARFTDLGLIPAQEIARKNSEYAAEVLRRPAGSVGEAKERVEALTRLQGGVFDWLDAMKACLEYAKLDLQRLERGAMLAAKEASAASAAAASAAMIAADAASSAGTARAASAAAAEDAQRKSQALAAELAAAHERARLAKDAYDERVKGEMFQKILDKSPRSK